MSSECWESADEGQRSAESRAWPAGPARVAPRTDSIRKLLDPGRRRVEVVVFDPRVPFDATVSQAAFRSRPAGSRRSLSWPLTARARATPDARRRRGARPMSPYLHGSHMARAGPVPRSGPRAGAPRPRWAARAWPPRPRLRGSADSAEPKGAGPCMRPRGAGAGVAPRARGGGIAKVVEVRARTPAVPCARGRRRRPQDSAPSPIRGGAGPGGSRMERRERGSAGA